MKMYSLQCNEKMRAESLRTEQNMISTNEKRKDEQMNKKAMEEVDSDALSHIPLPSVCLPFE